MSAPQLAPGTVVAQKYQLGACLGFAGSSATYQAVGSDGREVVLKLFDAAIRQRADIMAALEQTYAATNALPQDVAVPLLDAGYDAATGAPFSVSERIPFPSLGQLVTQRPLTPEETANVLALMAHVLDKAHARKLFHHALKPGNVFVGFAQGAGIRVTDFGAGLSRSAVPTQDGYALAAPWLAPEQVQGSAPPGAPADVFAAGLVAFFALTGRSYWRSCQSPLDLAGWQRELQSPRTPPSARALQLGVTLNSAFDGVLGCALSADPGQRYRSVGEFAHALEELAAQGAPASQATMALAYPQGAPPAMGGGGGGGYPPPPAPPPPGMPQGGPRMPSSPALTTQQVPGGYAPAPGPMSMPTTPGLGGPPGGGYPQSGMGLPPPQRPEAPPNAGYNSTQPSSDLGETAAGRPVDPAVFQRRASPNRLVPILVGLVALLLLLSAAAAFVLIGRKPDARTTTAASASAVESAEPVDSAAPSASASASAAPADSASAAPADSASAAPADSASAAPSADADAGPPQVEVALTCDPDCDEVKVDDVVVDITKPLTLPPGKHVVQASKGGYQTEKVTLKVKDGEKLEKTIKLKEKAAAPTGPAVAAPPKPCGKFLKRCK